MGSNPVVGIEIIRAVHSRAFSTRADPAPHAHGEGGIRSRHPLRVISR
jgi:hypothetical protein